MIFSQLTRLRARKLAAILCDGYYLGAFLRHGVAPAIEHAALLRGLPFDFVADVGANRGQFSLLCRRLRPEARIAAFEPLAGPAAVYAAVFSSDSRTRLHNCALGVTRGGMMMNIAGREDCSSLLPIAAAQTDNFPGTGKVAEQAVTIAPLTDFVKPSDLGGHSLLKIDVQGYELEVLKSAEPLLPLLRWIYVECSFTPLYEGQPLERDIVAYLQSRGFKRDGQFNPCYAAKSGSLLQADILFTRVSP